MNPTHIKAYSRFKNKQWKKEANRGKAKIQMGALSRATVNDYVRKCKECKKPIYLVDRFEDVSDLMEKDRILLCPICVITIPKYSTSLLEEQKRMILDMHSKEIMERENEKRI